MNDENLVKIKFFNTIGDDERGITAEFFLPRKQSDFIFITRKENSISGHTYHKGKNSGTAPKIFILIQGEINFSYRSIENNKKIEVYIKSPAQIEVMPNVTHAIAALTDIMVLECNSLSDIQEDRVREQV